MRIFVIQVRSWSVTEKLTNKLIWHVIKCPLQKSSKHVPPKRRYRSTSRYDGIFRMTKSSKLLLVRGPGEVGCKWPFPITSKSYFNVHTIVRNTCIYCDSEQNCFAEKYYHMRVLCSSSILSESSVMQMRSPLPPHIRGTLVLLVCRFLTWVSDSSFHFQLNSFLSCNLGKVLIGWPSEQPWLLHMTNNQHII
jgi:hypothetical protein